MVNKYRSALLALFLMQPVVTNVFASQGMQIDNMIVVAQNDQTADSLLSQDMPLGQGGDEQTSLLPEDDATGDTVFGVQGGYFHAYLGLSEEYSDNLFNVVDERKIENWLTTISPGLWLALPRAKEVPITITPQNTSPGGLRLALPDLEEGFERYNFYLLGGLDMKFYSEDSDLNDTDGRVEGMFQYNFPVGLSLRAVDRYSHGQDMFDVGNSTADAVRTFDSNFVQGTADWDVTEKFRTKIDYSNFQLDYKDTVDNFLDRADNAASVYAIFKYSPKTDFFLEYRYIDISYDHVDSEVKDNNNNFVYGGIHWATTEKTSLRLKAGYQKKNYDHEVADRVNSNPDGFAFEGQLDYQFTVKTDLVVKLSNKIEESDSRTALNTNVFAGSLLYSQQFLERWKGLCYISYESDDYDQVVGPDRDDDRFLFSPSIQYLFNDWFMSEFKYTYDMRNSSNDIFDYDTNRVLLSLNFAL